MALSVVLVLLLYNQPNFALLMATKKLWPSPPKRPDAGGPGRFVSDLGESASLLPSLPPFPALCFVLCHSLSRRFSHLWIKSANPRCDNFGVSPPFHRAIHALRRHRLLLQSLDAHAAVVETRGRRGVLRDTEDVTECGPASAADQTDFCAADQGLRGVGGFCE